MKTHDDNDSPLRAESLFNQHEKERKRKESESLQRLEQRLERRALELSYAGRNIITSGCDGEMLLFEVRRGDFLIRRLPDDPDGVLRVSLGAPGWDTAQSYLVLRGNPVQLYDLLRKASKALGKCISEMQSSSRAALEGEE